MCVLRRHVRKNNPRRNIRTRPGNSGLTEVLLPQVWEAQEPENGIFDPRKDPEPGTESCRFNLKYLLDHLYPIQMTYETVLTLYS